MNKTNLKRIKSRYNGAYIWWGVLCYAAMMLAAVIFLKDSYAMEFLVYFLTIGIVLLIATVIVVVIVSLVRSALLKKMIMSQGDLNSFNQEEFMEVGYSHNIYVSANWFLWNRGFEYRIFHRSHIRGCMTHPNQRAGNTYAVCDLYTDKSQTPLNLYYTYVPGVDLPGMIQGWLNPYGIPAQQPAMNYTVNAQQMYAQPAPQAYAQPVAPAVPHPEAVPMSSPVCPDCGRSLRMGARFCEFCGRRL